MRMFFTCLMLLCASSIFAQEKSTAPFALFAKGDFQLLYPSNWTIDSADQSGAEVFIRSPLENKADRFRENINVMVQNLIGMDFSLRDYKIFTEHQLKDLATDLAIHQSEVIDDETGNYYKLDYEMTQGVYRLHVTSYCIIQNKKAWLATFTGEAGKYTQYKDAADSMLKSFKLGK